jgi:hypothetical protein
LPLSTTASWALAELHLLLSLPRPELVEVIDIFMFFKEITNSDFQRRLWILQHFHNLHIRIHRNFPTYIKERIVLYSAGDIKGGTKCEIKLHTSRLCFK